MELYIYNVTDLVGALKGVRDLKRTYDIEYTQSDAEIVTAAALAGVALVGNIDVRPTERFDSFEFSTDLSDEDIEALIAQYGTADDAQYDEDDLTQEHYQTALALLFGAQGDPVKSIGLAAMYARATGDEHTYINAVRVIVDVFPWVAL